MLHLSDQADGKEWQMTNDYTGYFILYGGILLFVFVICVIDWFDRRRERR